MVTHVFATSMQPLCGAARKDTPMPLDQNELEILAARFVLDKVEAYEVRDLADRLTTEGDDDPVLIEIYIEGADLTREMLRPYLERFLSGRVELPTPENAAVDLAYRYCKRATLGLMEYVAAVGAIETLYEPFRWNGMRLDLSVFDTFANDWWNAPGQPDWRLSTKAGHMPDDICQRLVEDFEVGEMRRWMDKPPVKSYRAGFIHRLLGN